jgi:hypothetical protein
LLRPAGKSRTAIAQDRRIPVRVKGAMKGGRPLLSNPDQLQGRSRSRVVGGQIRYLLGAEPSFRFRSLRPSMLSTRATNDSSPKGCPILNSGDIVRDGLLQPLGWVLRPGTSHQPEERSVRYLLRQCEAPTFGLENGTRRSLHASMMCRGVGCTGSFTAVGWHGMTPGSLEHENGR